MSSKVQTLKSSHGSEFGVKKQPEEELHPLSVQKL